MQRYLTNLLTRVQKHLHNTPPSETNIIKVKPPDPWSTIILNLAQFPAKTAHAVMEASHLLTAGTKPSGPLLVQLIKASSTLAWDLYALQLHSYVIRSGFRSDVFILTALINFYVKIGNLINTQKVFDEIPVKTIVSWNSLVSGYTKSGEYSRALNVFLQMERSGVCVDSYSLTAVLGACGQLGLLRLGESVHAKITKMGLRDSNVVMNCLIDMYGKCRSVEDAVDLFDNMRKKDTISWNSVIAASARNGRLEEAFGFFQRMYEPDVISYNELINGFARFGDMGLAIELLYSMPNPKSSSWNSIITGYVNRGRAQEALDIFCKMQLENVRMDDFTFSSILSGVAGISALTWGVLIHCCTVKCGLARSVVVGSVLIDMYSKCGKVSNAEMIFRLLPTKNLVTWNAMISGFSWNGNPSQAVLLFEQMKRERGVKPDEITFLNVISACSHNQIPFKNALQYFESMIEDYGIEPTVEHCCSMIRLMGKKREVRRAEKLIFQLGFGECMSVWRALLSACEDCRDLMVAKYAAAKVIQLEGDDEYVYVKMSNLYAYFEEWENVRVVRMKVKGMRREAGYSWIEMKIVNSNSEFR